MYWTSRAKLEFLSQAGEKGASREGEKQDGNGKERRAASWGWRTWLRQRRGKPACAAGLDLRGLGSACQALRSHRLSMSVLH